MNERTRIRSVNLLAALLTSSLRLVVLWGLCLLPAATRAQSAELNGATKPLDLTEVPIEDLLKMEVPTVSSASKFPQKTTEAPASVSVITSEDIKLYGYRTLASALRSLQGFHVTYDRNYMFLGTRGVSLGDFNSRTLLLVDGHRVNNNLTDGAYLGTAFILDMDLIDQVEVIRGPGSALYGNNAFFGVINVVTRKGRQIDGFETSGEYASFDTWKGRVTYGKAFTNGLELVLSGSYYDSQGQENLYFPEFDTPQQNNGIAHDMDADKYGSFFGSVAYSSFTLEGGFIDRKKENPTAWYGSAFNDQRLRTDDDRSYVNLKFAHEVPDVVDLTAQVYYDRSDFEVGYPVSVAGFEDYTKDRDVGEWWGAELQLRKELWERHIVSVGAEYRDDFRQDQLVWRPATGETIKDISRSRQNYGIYAEADFAVITNLHLNAGVRFDKYSDFDPSVNPRFALIYHPLRTSTLKAIYGSAFRAPNFLELSDERFQNIQPEEIYSYELVYEQGIGRYLRSSVAGFYNQMDDLIVVQNGQFNNLDVDSRGVEVALEASLGGTATNWASGIKARASYTFQDAEDRSTEKTLADSPANLVKFNLSVPIVKNKLFASLEYQFTDKRGTLYDTTDINGQPATLPGRDVPAFDVLNFTLFSQNLIKNLDISASIYNLLDNEYADPSTRFHLQDRIINDGRTFRVKLTYRF